MNELPLQQTVERVVQLQNAGRLTDAEALSAALVEQNSNHPGLLHLRGLLNYQLARYELAVVSIGRAAELDPNNPEIHSNLGVVLLAAGRAQDAAAACARAIQLRPNYPEALNNLGNVARAMGRNDEAIDAYGRALAQRPAFAEAQNNLGNVLKATGQLPQAIAAYRQALVVNPNYADAHYNLGTALRECGQLVEAVDAFLAALRLQPGYPEANAGLCEAERARGVALEAAGEIEHAIARYRTAVEVGPNDAAALLSLAKLLAEGGQTDDAIALQRRAINVNPAKPEPHLHLAVTLLAAGRFDDGWREYEWRRGSVANDPKQWHGEAIERGSRLLVEAEQGMGDAIQFARYLPLLAERGATVLFRCDRALVRLFRGLNGVSQIVADDQSPDESPPAAELHCPLLSLPLAFATSDQTIPAAVPYLRADPADVARFAEKLPGEGGRLRVGVAWAGNRGHRNDAQRSLPPEALAALSAVSGVQWVNLQLGASPEAMTATGLSLIDLMRDVGDFADTAGLLANLDLIITADTAVAHLAGAMGKPVWLLLSTAADFRWLTHRDDSPWYPTMRLFRQTRRGDWAGVMERVRAALTSNSRSS